jgi:hypothetical protein
MLLSWSVVCQNLEIEDAAANLEMALRDFSESMPRLEGEALTLRSVWRKLIESRLNKRHFYCGQRA